MNYETFLKTHYFFQKIIHYYSKVNKIKLVVQINFFICRILVNLKRKAPLNPILSAPLLVFFLVYKVRYNPKLLAGKPVCAQTPFGSTVKLDRSLTNGIKN